MAPLFAVLLASGLLLGTGAIVLDVGRVFAEREELQNGADAAAMAAALSCARNDACKEEDLLTIASSAAGKNASDDAVGALVTCGQRKDADGDFVQLVKSCTDAPTNRTGCVGPRPAANYVEVQTSTKDKDGGTILPYTFAQTLAGAKAGVTVAACARASWTAAGKTPRAFPMMISSCAWRVLTKNGTELSGKPDNPFVPSSPMVTVAPIVTNATTRCDDSVATIVGPASGSSDCNQAMDANVQQAGLPANGIWTNALLEFIHGWTCGVGHFIGVLIDRILDFILRIGIPVRVAYIPVYDDISFRDPIAEFFGVKNYHVVGFAPFVLTSAHTSFLGASSPGVAVCEPFPCISGYFARDVIPGDYGGAGENFGFSNLKTVG
jgi:hypothetical protein